jgi:hypothetical protein
MAREPFVVGVSTGHQVSLRPPCYLHAGMVILVGYGETNYPLLAFRSQSPAPPPKFSPTYFLALAWSITKPLHFGGRLASLYHRPIMEPS